MKPTLTLQALMTEAGNFAARESAHWESSLFGVTDGKAVGSYFEHKFRSHVQCRDTREVLKGLCHSLGVVGNE